MMKYMVLACLFILSTTVTGTFVRVDSVTVDSIWNADSSWYDTVGEFHQRSARDLFLSFNPVSDSLSNVQTFINMTLDDGATWDSTSGVFRVLDIVRGALLPVNKKHQVHIRVVGRDRPNVAFQVTITGTLTDIGKTMRMKVQLPPDSQSNGQPVIDQGSLTTLVNFPFKGGMSPDGSYLATAYRDGYLYNTRMERVFEVNPGYQITNASISPDQTKYPGCMLWLNFSGLLNVIVPDAWKADYSTTNVLMHDRLTITDTNNTVRWFMSRPSFLTGELQDPEWSSHPDYIACLGAENLMGTFWNGYFIRISDKVWFKWNSRMMKGQSDPCVWLPDTISSTATPPDSILKYDTDGLIEKPAVVAFFNTPKVKVAYLFPDLTGTFRLNYIDYNQASPQSVQLPMPTGKQGWNCENPQISPDGKWVTYHCYFDKDYAAYIQQLLPKALPVLLKEGGSMPHWWKDPTDGNLYIIYNTGGTLTLEQFISRNKILPSKLAP